MIRAETAFDVSVKDLLAEISSAGKWVKPWVFRLPRNLQGRIYSGSNVFTLLSAMREYDWVSPYFGTFLQAKELGYPVPKGEKAVTRVIFAGNVVKKLEGDSGKNEIKDKLKAKVIDEDKKLVFKYSEHAVWNAEQIKAEPLLVVSVTPDELTDKVLDWYSKLGVCFHWGLGERAAYSPLSHSIELPRLEVFHEQAGFVATAIHELIHWTAKDLLPRELSSSFGSPEYAKEELIAELSSLMLLGELGVSGENQKAYLKSWLGKFEQSEHEGVLAEALRVAGKVVGFVAERVGV